MSLPANVKTGTIRGVFLRAVVDGADADRDPDGIPIAGLEVVFTASINPAIVRNMSAVPPVTILIDPVPATTNSEGVLIGPDGTDRIKLVSSTDEALSPHGWTWNVSIRGTTFPKVSFSFVLPPDNPADEIPGIDLTTVVPVPPAPGSDLVAWQLAVEETLTNAAGARLAADEAQQAAEDAGAFAGTNNAQVAAMVTGDGPTKAALSGTYGIAFPATQIIAYSGDGAVQTVTENGITTTYTYNADGTVHTDSRAGVTRTYTYDTSGKLTRIEAA
jgi:YD repeat-containing protein